MRSGKEITFFKLLEDNNVTVLNTNKSYPNFGRNFYDFLVDINGLEYYIEIIGDDSESYKKKLLEREKKFGSLLISENNYSKFFADIAANAVEKGRYHDW